MGGKRESCQTRYEPGGDAVIPARYEPGAAEDGGSSGGRGGSIIMRDGDDMNEAQVRTIEQMREVLSGETGSTVHGLDRGCGAVQVD